MNLNDPIVRFERQVLEVLLQVPQAADVSQVVKLVRAGFSEPQHNELLTVIGSSISSISSPDWLQTVSSNCPEQLLPILRESAATNLPASDEEGLRRYGQGVIAKALTNLLAREKADLLAALRRLNPETESDEVANVQRGLVELETERRKLIGA
jgi:DNA primase